MGGAIEDEDEAEGFAEEILCRCEDVLDFGGAIEDEEIGIDALADELEPGARDEVVGLAVDEVEPFADRLKLAT